MNKTKQIKLARILNKIDSEKGLTDFAAQELQRVLDEIPAYFADAITPFDERAEQSETAIAYLHTHLESEVEKVEKEATRLSKKHGDDLGALEKSLTKLMGERATLIDLSLKKFFHVETEKEKRALDKILKKIEKDIEDLFWTRSLNGSNNVQAVLNIKSNGIFVNNNVTGINFTTNITVTDNKDGTVTVSSTGGSAVSFVDNEVVAGSGTTFTLANTPILGSVHLYGFGQRLTPGGVDYSITGGVITTINSFAAGSLLADYRK